MPVGQRKSMLMWHKSLGKEGRVPLVGSRYGPNFDGSTRPSKASPHAKLD